MTSKEKLLQLRHDFYNSEELNYDSISYFTTIEKDLELLEILKYLISHLEATFNTKHFSNSGIMGTIIKDYFINNDFTGKVKEWLNDQ